MESEGLLCFLLPVDDNRCFLYNRRLLWLMIINQHCQTGNLSTMNQTNFKAPGYGSSDCFSKMSALLIPSLNMIRLVPRDDQKPETFPRQGRIYLNQTCGFFVCWLPGRRRRVWSLIFSSMRYNLQLPIMAQPRHMEARLKFPQKRWS